MRVYACVVTSYEKIKNREDEVGERVIMRGGCVYEGVLVVKAIRP